MTLQEFNETDKVCDCVKKPLFEHWLRERSATSTVAIRINELGKEYEEIEYSMTIECPICHKTEQIEYIDSDSATINKICSLDIKSRTLDQVLTEIKDIIASDCAYNKISEVIREQFSYTTGLDFDISNGDITIYDLTETFDDTGDRKIVISKVNNKWHVYYTVSYFDFDIAECSCTDETIELLVVDDREFDSDQFGADSMFGTTAVDEFETDTFATENAFDDSGYMCKKCGKAFCLCNNPFRSRKDN